MTNARYVDIENEVLRAQVREYREALAELSGAVDAYVVRQTILRSALLNVNAKARALLDRGGGEEND